MLNYYNTGVTVELNDLLEAGVNVFDFDYPVPRSELEYNGKTCVVDFNRARLEEKILNRYRFRQIGQETVGRFKHYLKTRMQEIMPYYIQLYEFDAKFRNIEDPLESYNLTESFLQETEGTHKGSGTNNATTNGTTKFSDTPQGSISNIDNYLTNATKIDNIDTGGHSQEGEEKGKTTSTLTRKGNIGVQPLGGEVENIRKAFINIDAQIVDELKDLFLQVY